MRIEKTDDWLVTVLTVSWYPGLKYPAGSIQRDKLRRPEHLLN